MIECREKRDFREESLKQGLETTILFSPSIVNYVIQSMRLDNLSPKVQAAATDVFDWMWMCGGGAVGIMLHKMSIECETLVDGSYVEPCLLTCEECLGSTIDEFWAVKEKDYNFEWRRLQWMARQPLSIYIAPFASSRGYGFLFKPSNKKFDQFVTLCSLCNIILQWSLSIWISFTSINLEAWQAILGQGDLQSPTSMFARLTTRATIPWPSSQVAIRVVDSKTTTWSNKLSRCQGSLSICFASQQ